MNFYKKSCRAFTLIELLVVMAIIVVLLGIVGVALSSGSGRMATEAGQRTLSSMISTARSQAVLNQASVRVIMHVDPPDPSDMSDSKREKYLRFVTILIRDGSNPQGWRELNEGEYLPKGIYFVPTWDLEKDPSDPDATTPPATPTTPIEVISTNTLEWNHERRTVVSPITMEYVSNYIGTAKPPVLDREHYMYIEFNARGMTATRSWIGVDEYDRRIVIAPATQTAVFPKFEAKGDINVAGGMIRQNGSFTVVQDPEGFPEKYP